jgi:hypothetical protein
MDAILLTHLVIDKPLLQREIALSLVFISVISL